MSLIRQQVKKNQRNNKKNIIKFSFKIRKKQLFIFQHYFHKTPNNLYPLGNVSFKTSLVKKSSHVIINGTPFFNKGYNLFIVIERILLKTPTIIQLKYDQTV